MPLDPQIAHVDLDDGVVFDTELATAEVIEAEDHYTGVRVSMAAILLPAQLRFHVDVNVGDPTTPAPEHVQVPKLLAGGITVLGYPLAMVHAEKIVTAVARGAANTRWRDFVDVYILSGHYPVDGDERRAAISDVAAHRDVAPVALTEVLDGFGAVGQVRWAAWRKKEHLEDGVPEDFGES